MPHVIVKCYPGKTKEQKDELAKKITEDIEEVFGSNENAISVDIIDIEKENWKSDVYDKEINPKMDTLYKKPGYKM